MAHNKISVPKEMLNITKNDNVVVKINNISKSNKEPSVKIISSDINKPKIISDGKESNVDILRIKNKKAKDLGEKMKEKNLKRTMYLIK
jgi:hypothetical protein